MLPCYYATLRALERCCRFYPGSWDKRFVRQMSALGPYDMLTPKQEVQVQRLAFSYRKQLSRAGFHPPFALMEAYYERVRAKQAAQGTPDSVKYHWTGGKPPKPAKEKKPSPQLALEIE